MLNTTLSILLVGFLPGALLFRLPIARRELRERLSAEERIFWYVALSVVISSVVGLGTAAADWYRFDRVLWLNAALCLIFAVLSRGRFLLSPGAPPLGPTALLPAGLVALAIGIFFHVPAAEYVIGGRDPGVYINEGIQIAQRGSLTIDDDLVASVPAEFRDLFFLKLPSDSYYGTRFLGFFLVDADRGQVVGQFPHLFPVWVAFGYGVNGLTGARQVVGLFAVMGVLAVYFLGVWLVGRPGAIVGASLLTLNVAQVWYSRYPNAEMPLQVLACAGLLACSRSSVDKDRFFGPIAAVLFTLSAFAHFSAVLVIGGVGVALLLGLIDERRLQTSFFLPLAAGGLLAAWYFSTTLGQYLERPTSILLRAGPLQVASMVAGGVALLALLWTVRHDRLRSVLRAHSQWCILGALVCLATYAYFFRESAPGLAIHDAGALRDFARVYVTPIGLATAFVGLAILVRQSFWRNATFLMATVVFACFIFYKIRIIPEHFWLSRRFLPIILPATCLLIGTVVAYPSTMPWRRALSRPLRFAILIPGLLLWAFLSAQFLSVTRPILEHVEYAGVIPRLEALEAQFADEDLILVEARDASDLHTLAVPLAYVYARHVLLLNDRDPDPHSFSRFLTWAKGRYRRVLFVGGGGSQILSPATMATPVGTEHFFVPEYERSYPTVPQEVRLKQYNFGVYELFPRLTTATNLDVDVGNMDDLYVARFHGKESGSGGRHFRWSTATSFVLIPQLAPEAQTLTVWLSSGGRPPSLSLPTVEVFIVNQPLGTVTVSDGFQPYEFAISQSLAEEIASSDELVQVTLSSNTWSPSGSLGGDDIRELGVMVDRLRIE